MAILSVNPIVEAAIERGHIRLKDGWQLVYVLAGTGLGVILRISEGGSPIYTPDGMAGPNKDDFATIKTRTTVKATTTTNADTGVQEDSGVISSDDYPQ